MFYRSYKFSYYTFNSGRGRGRGQRIWGGKSDIRSIPLFTPHQFIRQGALGTALGTAAGAGEFARLRESDLPLRCRTYEVGRKFTWRAGRGGGALPAAAASSSALFILSRLAWAKSWGSASGGRRRTPKILFAPGASAANP